MAFTFIHAADLHIDSPLASLGLKDRDVAARFADAGRRAVEALVDETIASNAAFLIVAGDIFDGDWKDIATGLFFVRALGKLHRAGIPVFIINGNHDAISVMSRGLTYPDSVRVFPADESSTFTLDDLQVALHGRSFPHRLNADFVETYPPRRDGWLNIGILHTSLDGRSGHEGYASCSVDQLKRFGYDYWALGHVHQAEIVSRDPWVVFPGNVQGRNVRESGPKGAMRVRVDEGRVTEVTPITLDSARWDHVTVDVAQADHKDDVAAAIGEHLSQAHQRAEGRPLAIRITLTGDTPLHPELVARREAYLDEARAAGFRIAADCWIEQLKVRTSSPPLPALSAEAGVETERLLADAANDQEFGKILAELVDTVKSKLPNDLHGALLTSDVLLSLDKDALALLAGELK